MSGGSPTAYIYSLTLASQSLSIQKGESVKRLWKTGRVVVLTCGYQLVISTFNIAAQPGSLLIMGKRWTLEPHKPRWAQVRFYFSEPLLSRLLELQSTWAATGETKLSVRTNSNPLLNVGFHTCFPGRDRVLCYMTVKEGPHIWRWSIRVCHLVSPSNLSVCKCTPQRLHSDEIPSANVSPSLSNARLLPCRESKPHICLHYWKFGIWKLHLV